MQIQSGRLAIIECRRAWPQAGTNLVSSMALRASTQGVAADRLFVHADEPLRSSAVDQRLVTPAVHVAVFMTVVCISAPIPGQFFQMAGLQMNWPLKYSSVGNLQTLLPEPLSESSLTMLYFLQVTKSNYAISRGGVNTPVPAPSST